MSEGGKLAVRPTATLLAMAMSLAAAPQPHAQQSSVPPTAATLSLGGELYTQRCAGCHDNPAANSRAPIKAELAAQSGTGIVQILMRGPMQSMAAGLGRDEMSAIAAYLTGKVPPLIEPVVPDLNPCKTSAPIVVSEPQWNGWGRDLSNTRYQPDPGLKAADVPRLKLKWSFVYPGGVNSLPVIVGGRVFVASFAGVIYSLDEATGCVHWRRNQVAGVRTALVIAPLAGRSPSKKSGPLAGFYGDNSGAVHALDAQTGKPIWETKLDDHPRAQITGSPVLYRGRLYVPMASMEEGVGSSRTYGCCTFRGSVSALDAATGKLLWKTYTIENPPAPIGVNAAGQQMYGPSGAGVWSPPTIDPSRGVLYVGTGDGYSEGPTDRTDAVIAIDLVTGKVRWVRQATADDAYLAGCADDAHGANCPKVLGPDVDFSAPTILRRLANGREVLLAGQKSGVVWGLDPDHEGKVLWRTSIGYGSAVGGVQWGMAADAHTLYAPVSDAYVAEPDNARPGLTALSIADGKVLWRAEAPPSACPPSANPASRVGRCSRAVSAAVTAMPGVVFASSMDGHMRAYDSKDGKVVWEFASAARTYDPVNRPGPVKGGQINGAGLSVAHGMVFQHTGYISFSPSGANVLLAFSVDGK